MTSLYVCVTFVTLCVAGFVWETNAQSNCATGSACNSCPPGEFNTLTLASGRLIKVCAPGCGTYFRSGYQNEATQERPWCQAYSVDNITGDCWKGHQCDTCLAGPNKDYVGYINSIPICCAGCERSGMAISSTSCSCLHNGA